MRAARASLLVLAACNAKLHLGDQDGGLPDAHTDARPIDGPPDAPPDARPCTGMTAPDGSCFVMNAGPNTYAEAKAACAAMTAHLALLKTAALDAAAEVYIGNVDTFIGGSDAITEGTWLWDDGTPFTYTNWRTGEPNNGNGLYQEDCLAIDGSRAGKGWDDRPCDSSQVATSGRFAFLCQY